MPKRIHPLWVKILDNMRRLYATIYSPYERQGSLRKLLIFVIFFLILGFICPLKAAELPDLGNSSSAVLTPVQESELGRSIMKELQRAQAISDDAYVSEYLQGLGYRLIATQGVSLALMWV